MGIHENLIQSFTNFKNKFIGNIGNSTIAELLSDKVSKSGDTITGNLIQSSGLFQQKYNGDVKIQLLSDNEGGNISIYPPDSISDVSYWQADAIDGNLRIFVRDGNGVFKFPFTLLKDGTATISQINNNVALINTGSRANLDLKNSTHSGFLECNGSNLGLALYGGNFATVLNWLAIRPDYTEFNKSIWANGIKNSAGWADWYNGTTNRGSIYCNTNDNDFYVRANVNGSSLHLNCANNIRLESDNGTLVVNRAGYWQNIAANAFNVQSSRKVKENIKDITENEAKKILDVEVVSFDYIEKVGGAKDNYGVIAEDVEKIIPSVVTIPQDYDETSDDYLNTPSVDYSKFVPFLIKLCQTQQKQIDDLTKRIEKLESK